MKPESQEKKPISDITPSPSATQTAWKTDLQLPASGYPASEVSAEEFESEEATTSEPVQWVASEYIPADKNILWYICLGIFVAAVVTLDVLVLKAWTVSVLVVVAAAVVIVLSVRPPRSITYTLSSSTLRVGEVDYNLSDYRAFGIMHDGKENSILLVPVRRFRPGLSVYFPAESGEQIVDLLGDRLPLQEVKPDFVDGLVRLLRL